MDSSTITLWAGPFPIERVSSYLFITPRFMAISVFNANSLDRVQTPRTAASDLGLDCLPKYAASDLGLDCLPMSLL